MATGKNVCSVAQRVLNQIEWKVGKHVGGGDLRRGGKLAQLTRISTYLEAFLSQVEEEEVYWEGWRVDGEKNYSGITFLLNMSPSAECRLPPHCVILEYPSAKLKVFVNATRRLWAMRHGASPSFPPRTVHLGFLCLLASQSKQITEAPHTLPRFIFSFSFFRPDTPKLFPRLFAVFILINTKSSEWAGCAASRSWR